MAPPATPPTRAPMAAPSHPPASAPTPAPTAAPPPAPIAVRSPGVAHATRATTRSVGATNDRMRISFGPPLFPAAARSVSFTNRAGQVAEQMDRFRIGVRRFAAVRQRVGVRSAPYPPGAAARLDVVGG